MRITTSASNKRFLFFGLSVVVLVYRNLYFGTGVVSPSNFRQEGEKEGDEVKWYQLPPALDTARRDSNSTRVTGRTRKGRRRKKRRPQPILNRNETATATRLSVAVCHRPMFGDPNNMKTNVSVSKIMEWALYNKKLGFDHVFLFYRPTFTALPGWEVINSKSWITAAEFTKAGKQQGQIPAERECLTVAAKQYDWVMLADADEFLWFPKSDNVKDFLRKYERKKQTFISLEKVMYTPMYSVHGDGNHSHSGLSLERFPFTAGQYCYNKRKRFSNRPSSPFTTTKSTSSPSTCRGWRGRCKLIVKPSHHDQVGIHGDDVRGEGVHLPVSKAHLKEWPGWLVRNNGENERLPRDLLFEQQDNLKQKLRIHSLEESIQFNKNESLTLRYDQQWQKWAYTIMTKQV